MRHFWDAKVVVSIYGFGLAALGYWIGGGRPLLGLLALSPSSIVIWVPIVGIASVILFWPCLGYMLQSARLPMHRIAFIALMLLHYAGAVAWILQDLARSGPSQDISDIWQREPIGFLLFVAAYLIGQLLMWAYLIRQIPTNGH